MTQRAQINRKTFYLHYNSLDDLLEELQLEIIEHFTRREVSYSNMNDIKDLIRVFFEHATHMPLLHERLMCSGSCYPFWEKINKQIMEHRKETNRGGIWHVQRSKKEMIETIRYKKTAYTSGFCNAGDGT